MSTATPAQSSSKPLPELVEQALASSFFIVQTCGPTKWILKDGTDQSVYKVSLGERHSCTCASFRGTCVHLVWTLNKRFKIPPTSELLLQPGLKERDISALMLMLDSQVVQTTRRGGDSAVKDKHSSGGAGSIEQRPIAEGDVCPICQESLLPEQQDSTASAITYCRHGCGNSIHLSCMKMVADHQLKAMGHSTVTCPLCRCEFGTVEAIQIEHKEEAKKQFSSRARDLHFGTNCRICRMCPIRGPRYRCLDCKTFDLCHECYDKGGHPQHAFECRTNRKSDWVLTTRYVEQTVPESRVAALSSRDITDEDYDLLLSLDAPKHVQGHQVMHIVGRFPLHKLELPNVHMTDVSCIICEGKFINGDVCRLLPCGHSKFHKDCIDRWLMRNSSTCVQCSSPAYTCLDGSKPMTIDLTGAVYIPVTPAVPITDEFSKALCATQATKERRRQADAKRKAKPKSDKPPEAVENLFQVSGARMSSLPSAAEGDRTVPVSKRLRPTSGKGPPHKPLGLDRGYSSISLPPLLGSSLSGITTPAASQSAISKSAAVAKTSKVATGRASKRTSVSAPTPLESSSSSLSLPPLQVRSINKSGSGGPL